MSSLPRRKAIAKLIIRSTRAILVLFENLGFFKSMSKGKTSWINKKTQTRSV